MTNRPRRSRPSGTRKKTIDLTAERGNAATPASKDAPVAPTRSDSSAAPSGAHPATADETAVSDFAAEEGLNPTPTTPDARTESEEPAASSSQTRDGASPADQSARDGASPADQSARDGAPPADQGARDGAPPAPQTDPMQDRPSPSAASASSASPETSEAAAERKAGRSDWAKTGGYQGPAAVTRVAEKTGGYQGPAAVTRVAEPQARPREAGSAASDRPAPSGSAHGSPSAGSGGGDRTASTPPASSGVGFGGALAAGLVGAIIALGGAAALYAYGYLPLTPTVTEEQQAAGERLDTLGADVAALREELATLGAAPDVAGLSPEALAALTQRVDALESAPAVSAPAVDGEAPAGLSPEEFAALAQRVESLEAAGAGSEELAAAVRAAGDSATAAQGRADEAAAGLTTLDERITAGETATRTAQESADAAAEAAGAAQSSVDSLRSDVEQRLADLEASSDNARLALAAAGLKSAVDSGNAYSGELRGYENAGGSGDLVSTLQGSADSGVPTRTELAAAWPDVEDRVAAALAGPGADAPVTDQLFAGLSTLVQTRPVGPVEEGAEGSDAALARLEQAITTGDLNAFSEEWQTLPEEVRQAGSDFYGDVEARLAADRALSDALSAAIGGGSGAGGSGQPAGSQPPAETPADAPADAAGQTNQG